MEVVKVLVIVLLLAWALPWLLNTVNLLLAERRVRLSGTKAWQRDWASHPLPTYRHDTGVARGRTIRALHVVPAKKSGMDRDDNHAA